MNTVLDEDISHLDFVPDDDDFHYAHPTDPSLRWCGERADMVYVYEETSISQTVQCEECNRLAGTVNWWRIHNKHFGSACHGIGGNHHSCGR